MWLVFFFVSCFCVAVCRWVVYLRFCVAVCVSVCVRVCLCAFALCVLRMCPVCSLNVRLRFCVVVVWPCFCVPVFPRLCFSAFVSFRIIASAGLRAINIY